MKNNILTKALVILLLFISVLLINISNIKVQADNTELLKPELTLSVDKTKLVNGDNVVFTISMNYSTLTNQFNGCPITIYQNGSRLSSVTMNETGTVTLKISIRHISSTSFDTYARFEGNDQYQACQSNTVHYDFVDKITPTIELAVIKNQVNNSYNLIFSGKISASDSHSFEGEYLELYDGNEENLVASIKINKDNSVAYEFVISGIQAVYHKFFFVYHGNDIYTTASSNYEEFGLVSVVVRTGETEVCEDEELPISVTVAYGLSMLEGITVKIYIDDVYERDLEITNGIGTFNYTVPHGLRGTHTVQAKFEGYGSYIGASSEVVSFVVYTARKPILVVSTAREAFTYLEKLVAVAYMTYESTPIEGASINFYLDEKALGTVKTDKDGYAQLEYQLTKDDEGTHKIRVEYQMSSDYYEAESYSEEFEVYKQYYIVTFDLQGIQADEISKKYVEAGNTLTNVETPKNKFYSFEGWYIDSDCEYKYDFNTILTEDITLYAKWSIIDFAIEMAILVGLAAITITLFIVFIHKLRSKPNHFISNRKKYSRRKL